jgi:hypothetical protein
LVIRKLRKLNRQVDTPKKKKKWIEIVSSTRNCANSEEDVSVWAFRICGAESRRSPCSLFNAGHRDVKICLSANYCSSCCRFWVWTFWCEQRTFTFSVCPTILKSSCSAFMVGMAGQTSSSLFPYLERIEWPSESSPVETIHSEILWKSRHGNKRSRRSFNDVNTIRW